MTELTAKIAITADRHFRTDHLQPHLKARSIRGGAVTLSTQGIKFLLTMASTAVLARLLTPADFGLIAMVATFTGFVGLFKDLGLSMATVQQAQVTHAQVSTLFWINVVLSAVLAGAGMCLAPVVAWLYGEPQLVWVTCAVSSTFLLGGMTAQHLALLRRQMRFGKLAVIDLLSIVLGSTTAILFALRGGQYWSLVAMIVVQAFVSCAGAWFMSGWKPGLPRRQSGVRPMLKFGGNLAGFNVLNYFTRNFDNVLVGAVLGAGAVGIYSRAYNLLLMPIRQLNGPLSAVAMPALSRLQDRPEEYRRFYLKAVSLIGFLSMPFVGFCAATTKDLVFVVLGPQWADAVRVFQCLTPAAFIGALNVAPGWLCGSLGHTERQLHWAIVSAPISIIAFVVGIVCGGVVGVAIAFSATWPILLVAFMAYACKGSPVSLKDIRNATWRPAVATIMASVITWVFADYVAARMSTIPRLCGSMGVFGFGYFATWFVLPHGAQHLRGMFRSLGHLKRGHSA
jgi:O-antigen/teichoic acid export membrane protein